MQTSKAEEYFSVIERHVLNPIQNTDVRDSCVASLLLLFAAIDGLGLLLHPVPNEKVGIRFKFFLTEYMGGDYKTHADRLYDLRCSLSHNALSLSAFMSRTSMGEAHHLKHDNALGSIFVSTPVFLRDFSCALDMVRKKLALQEELRVQAESRLEWVNDEQHPCWTPMHTPPGPISFVKQK
jgi:hypothetical protein